MNQRTSARDPFMILAHPAIFAALGLLLINDHVLRRLWPSPLTGKLGDFACMFFMPLIAAALMAALMPARSRPAGFAGFILVAGLFVAGKTLPAVRDAIAAAAQSLFGFPIGWRLDPTDLVALFALLPAWWLWARVHAARAPGRSIALPVTGAEHLHRTPVHASIRRPGARPSAPLALLALTLSALLTLADSPAPDPGICCLSVQDDQIRVTSGYYSFTSSDGGLTWQLGTGEGMPSRTYSPAHESGVVVDPKHPQLQYRFAAGQPIEATVDGGSAWQVAYRAAASEAADAYYRSARSGSPSVEAGPLDAVIDPKTGNAVFAMGQAGVLVYSSVGGWQRIAVGDYRPYDPGADVLALLLPELVVAAGLALLASAILALRAGRPRIRRVLVILGVLAWTVGAVLIPELMHGGGYGGIMAAAVALAGGLLLLPLAAYSAFQVGAAALPALGRLVLVALAAALLFMLPFVLWAAEALPGHTTALVFACLLGLLAVAAGYHWLGPLPPRSPSLQT